ncbi:MAG: apolipoprotein N-acyltransferase [Alphaproteobacteria bacterium]|nr:MAG: apolipoprotein N-acyltransferase [Alphaproteobacteria bacterium]
MTMRWVVLAGFLVSLGFAPVHAFSAYVVGFGIFMAILRENGRSLRAAVSIITIFTFFFLLSSFYWVVFSLSVDWKKYWPLAAPVLIGVPVLFGWIYGGVTLLWWRYCRNLQASEVILGILWWCAELFKEYIFIGFPWNIPADVWTSTPNGILYLSAYIGASGLNLLTLVGAMWLGRCLRYGLAGWHICALVVGAMMYLWVPCAKQPVRKNTVVLVQPSIHQSIKGSPMHVHDLLTEMRLYSSNPTPDPHATIIWAEGALPLAVKVSYPYGGSNTTTPGLEAYFSSITQGKNTLFATGITYHEEKSVRKIFNSMIHVDAHGKIVTKVSKARLLPFGEYLPFRRFFPQLFADLAVGPLDMSPDFSPSLLYADGLTWHILVCFESLFSDLARRYLEADVLVIVTNDAWFGHSPGPYQHLSAAILRAVETGIPVLRVANNGISAVIDGAGHRHAQLGINAKGAIHAYIPQAMPKTFFWRFPWVGVVLMVCALIVAIGIANSRDRRV